VAFDPRAASVAVAQGDGAVRRWATPRELRGAASTGIPAAAQGGRVALPLGGSGRVGLWDAGTGAPRAAQDTGLTSIAGLEYLRDGDLAVYGSGATRILGAQGRLIPHAVALSADGRVAVSESADQTRLTFARGTTRRVVRGIDGPAAPAISPDGALAALQREYESNWELVDTRSGRRVRVLAGSAAVDAMAFSPDGRRLEGTSSAVGQVRVWDVAGGRWRFTLGGQAANVTASFSPDGRYVVTADGAQQTVWDARTGRRLVDLGAAEWATMLPGDRAIVSAGLA
jgi:WD40 repeat protein